MGPNTAREGWERAEMYRGLSLDFAKCCQELHAQIDAAKPVLAVLDELMDTWQHGKNGTPEQGAIEDRLIAAWIAWKQVTETPPESGS